MQSRSPKFLINFFLLFIIWTFLFINFIFFTNNCLGWIFLSFSSIFEERISFIFWIDLKPDELPLLLTSIIFWTKLYFGDSPLLFFLSVLLLSVLLFLLVLLFSFSLFVLFILRLCNSKLKNESKNIFLCLSNVFANTWYLW